MATRSFSLSGIWQVCPSDGSTTFSVPVPGSLMGALDADGAFGAGGLFHRANNRRAAAFAHKDYRYSRDFLLDAAFLSPAGAATRRIFLEADGLDTLATIRVNGVELGRTENMHRRYRFDATESLVVGTNRIEIDFADAVAYIDRKQRERRLWHSYEGLPDYAMPGFNRIRKSHCSFGWDWGPIVPDLGIWRDIRLTRYEGARLGTPLVRQEHGAGRVDLKVSVPVACWGSDGPADGPAEFGPEGAAGYGVVFSLRGPDGEPVASSAVVHPDRSGKAAALLPVTDPKLWWPAGLGVQPLYVLETRLLDAAGEPVQASRLELGLRTLTVQREADRWGESFALVVNGVPFFARGADWIPDDVYLGRGGRERLQRLIDDAAAANFNCLRVWGGGVYPSDEFYALCDRAGLVVWQDLMFACATYDVSDPAFLANVLAELEDNLERLRHHASLGLVCGNNEMELAFVEWDMNATPKMRTEYLRQYQFEFPAVASRVAPDVFYWPASPSSGGDFDDPNDPDRGDTHFWEVWHGNADFVEYEKHHFRFMSEFGFESFPSLKTIESFTIPEDRNIFSPVMEDHQRCVGGNEKIFSYLSKYFRFPADFGSVLYLSQLSQAEAIRHGVEHWRRNRGRCMGAVYWQYNDNWPVASWSSVDYYGRWKALHYRAKVAFANALLSAKLEGAVVELHLSNESRRRISGRVVWRVVDLDGAVVASGKTAAEAEALSSVRVSALDLGAALPTPRDRLFFYEFRPDRAVDGSLPGAAAEGSPLRGKPVASPEAAASAEGGRGGSAKDRVLDGYADTVGTGVSFVGGCEAFLPFKALELRVPRIVVSAACRKDGATVVTLASDVPALFVELEGIDEDLVFSDNYFHLDGRTPRSVTVERGTLDPGRLGAALRVRSLRDSYT